MKRLMSITIALVFVFSLVFMAQVAETQAQMHMYDDDHMADYPWDDDGHMDDYPWDDDQINDYPCEDGMMTIWVISPGVMALWLVFLGLMITI
jgi:hypothetical protein